MRNDSGRAGDCAYVAAVPDLPSIQTYANAWRARAAATAGAHDKARAANAQLFRSVLKALRVRYSLSGATLFGSRARGTGGSNADWDIAVTGLDPTLWYALLVDLEASLGEGRVDLVRTEEMNGSLARRVAAGVGVDD
jgi:predicted nucleotidyltransferase